MKPWREIVTPHKDVLEGTFEQSKFAADILDVLHGKAVPEYQDAVKFFDRTFITEGMRLLLCSVIKRLAGLGGDPVVELQTNFGGGKTHSLLAVYHLASRKVPLSQLSGIPPLLDSLKIKTIPQANIAVICGTDLSPNQPMKKGSITIRTLWGYLAWQLLGEEGYEMVADSDLSGTAPGKPILVELLQKAAPCVLLMDELVLFFRQFNEGKNLTAGTFNSNLSFIQNLTESVKSVNNAVLLGSLPQSDAEVGDEFAKKALLSLEKYFGRVESVWKPVATDEAFEIVRRRLFEPIHDEEGKNEVCHEFDDFYRKHKTDFPVEIQNNAYLERLKTSYPIHPEVFDRLYKDWSTLEKFQRTRGVLQYMAFIIHRLWQMNNQDALIMPGSLPLDDANVRNLSAHYLPNGWSPILESEIDGENSEPAKIDASDSRFGSIQASRRITRTLFLGSAPSVDNQLNRGLRREQILLGCAIPKQQISVYDDAIKRLRDRLHYLFSSNSQYWFNTRPNLLREMESRKEKIDSILQFSTLKKTTESLLHDSDRYFLGIHVFTPHADIPDNCEDGPRLVVLPPDVNIVYDKSDEKSSFKAAQKILKWHGEQQRTRCNRLVFLVPSGVALIGRIKEQVKTVLAWKEIISDYKNNLLNLDAYEFKDANNSLEDAEKLLKRELSDCYRFVLIPKETKREQIGFTVVKLDTATRDNMSGGVKKILDNAEEFVSAWNPVTLCNVLQEYYFSRGKQTLKIETLWEDLCSYLYFQRLYSRDALIETIAQGVSKGLFGYAAYQDGELFNSFKFEEDISPIFIDSNAIIIATDVARKFDEKRKPPKNPPKPPKTPPLNPPEPGLNQHQKKYTHFYGSITIPASGGNQTFSKILDEVVKHFVERAETSVTLSLDIKADSETPFENDSIIRVVESNCKTLHFDEVEFSEE